MVIAKGELKMSQENEKLTEEVKYLIRRSKETANLLKDGKHVQAYHKSLGINQKLADLQQRLESGEIEVCDQDCPKQESQNGTVTSQNGRVVKYGDVKEVEKTG